MGFKNDVQRLLKVATKPDRKEIWLVIRVTAVGMGLLGLLGFLIKLAGDSLFQLSS
jgi:protein translocase SEC61 complex gamma subunit